MAIIFKLPSKDGNITPEKACKSRQMQPLDKTAYVRGLHYRCDPSQSRKPLRRLPHFMPPWQENKSSDELVAIVDRISGESQIDDENKVGNVKGEIE